MNYKHIPIHPQTFQGVPSCFPPLHQERPPPSTRHIGYAHLYLLSHFCRVVLSTFWCTKKAPSCLVIPLFCSINAVISFPTRSKLLSFFVYPSTNLALFQEQVGTSQTRMKTPFSCMMSFFYLIFLWRFVFVNTLTYLGCL